LADSQQRSFCIEVSRDLSIQTKQLQFVELGKYNQHKLHKFVTIDFSSTESLSTQDRAAECLAVPRSVGDFQVAELAAAVQQYNVEVVVTSPFLRCLQTTAAVCKALEPPITRVQVDNSLCEVASYLDMYA